MAKGVGGGGRGGRAGGRFRTFGGPMDADDWANLIYGKAAADLPGDVQNAINEYTGSAFDVINPQLRAGMSPGTGTIWGRLSIAIDRAMALAPRVPAGGLTVRRQISRKLSLGPGDVFDDLGFVSTSIKPGFGFGDATAMWNIQLPAGTKGIYVRSISQHKSEYEFLLPRGTEFTVVGPRTLRVTSQP